MKMARYGQRPENALKRANEFIEVGKPARALDTLQEVFRNKKWTYSWSESVLEPIMFKYLDLCVELKKSHIAKEGLFQYRNMFQSVNVGSLENVIRGYLRMAEEKTNAARKQSQQAVVDIDDLDNLATPESILLSAVSGEDAQDRSDRTILTPWVKFLWESYCQCLELLRTNAHVETLYHDIARMAFQFCLEYNRKTEFRKLCEKLRKHLEEICKLPQLVSNVSMNKTETQQLNLETRLIQLDSAIQMELWQEAYKATEDIHGLMNLSKKLPVPKTMANYYQKLAMVFWKAGNYLFHAAALLKLFQLSKEMKKNMSPDEQQRMANRVLLATLSIPLPSAHPEFDRFIETDKSPLEKAQKLAILLGLSQPPTRASLLRDVVRLNVVNLASPQLQDLYSWLEKDFHPLELCSRVQSVIQTLQVDETSTLAQYVPALQDVTLVRLVHQVSQVYQTIQFARLIELAKFTTAFHLERLLVDCVRYNDMQIRIDHGKRCIHFGVDLSEAQREDHPDGPVLQAMPSEQIRCQLVNMATVLHRAISVINPNKRKQEREKLRNAMVALYHETKSKEHQRILERQVIIEQRKEYIERVNTIREEEEMRRLEELHRQHLMAEQKRLEQEREERERKRQQSEIQQIKDRHLKEKMQQISQTSHGQKVLKKLDEDEIKKLDAEQIAAREAEELQKERREMQQKLKSQEKKVDYLERAKRIAEIPLLEKAVEEQQEQAKQCWEQQEEERILAAIEEHNQAVATRERMLKMKEDAEFFLSKILSERKNAYLEKLAEFEIKFNEERAKRLQERRAQRKAERREKWEREKAEAAERKYQEELRLKQEEERKRIEEERAKRDEEDRIRREEEAAKEAERLEKLAKQAEIIRAKEAEIERKLDEDRRKHLEPTRWRRTQNPEREQRSDRPERVGFKAGEREKPTEMSSWRGESKDEFKPRDDREDDRRRREDERAPLPSKWSGYNREKDRDSRFEKTPNRNMGSSWRDRRDDRRDGDDRRSDFRKDDRRDDRLGERGPPKPLDGLRRAPDDDRPRYQRSSASTEGSWRSRESHDSPRDPPPKRDERDDRDRRDDKPKREERREAPEDEGWSRVVKR
ncbi:eukaryotic translation initiation factor 3 subunit A [Diachasmimorpha longicaudata]|uniref:eukaryotic translation initiation factor 3 subunit A n=1 Tax=Diachasmimorpha longicaudata TaxID=58733 RepID=UPI0030B8B430